MAGDTKNPNAGMVCEFNRKSNHATLYDEKREVVATAMVGISTMDAIFGVRHDFVGASVMPSTSPPTGNRGADMYDLFARRTKDDGFHVEVRDSQGGICDVKLKDGQEFRGVKMKFVPDISTARKP